MTLELDLGADAFTLAETDRDSWTTPEWLYTMILRAFGRDEFDLDPCSNPRSRVPARRRVMLPEDGLRVRPEVGSLPWLNPPYSDVEPWFHWSQCAAHILLCTVVGVVPNVPGISAWRQYGPDLSWPIGRVHFDPPPGVAASSPSQEHTIVVWCGRGAAAPSGLQAAIDAIEAHERVTYRMTRAK